MSEKPLLSARDLRIDVAGAAELDHVSFTADVQSVAIVGDGSAIVRAIGGQAEIRTGELELLGTNVTAGIDRSAVVGFAPLDPPLVPRWTVREYLVWGARLSRSSHTLAKAKADETLSVLGFSELAHRPLESLAKADRRAVVLAQAVVNQPPVLVAEEPLSGLSGAEAEQVLFVFAEATRNRAWIASLGGVSGGSAPHKLAASADILLVFASGKLVRQAKLSELEEGAVGYTVMLRSNVEPFRNALADRGVELTGGPVRYFIELPARLRPADLLALSVEVGAPIIELVPRILLVES